MKYSFDFKLRQVKKYTEGKAINPPAGLTKSSFSKQVYRWVCLYRIGGEGALKHSTKGHHLSAEEKMSIARRALDGEPIVKLAALSGVSEGTVRRWMAICLEGGSSSLESRRRNPPVAKKNKKKSSSKLSDSERRELERLRLKSEMDDMEIAYLKKLRALVSEQVRGETRASGREPSENSSRNTPDGALRGS